MKIWALDDGIPGHWSMTEGLIRLIGRVRPVEVERIVVEWRWGAARQIFQRCERLGLPVPAWCVRWATRFSLPAGGSPDLLVSRGGATLFLNAWLARRLGCANVFVGTLRKLPPRLFRAVILRQDERVDGPYFPLPLFPTRMDPSSFDQALGEFAWTAGAPTGPVAALLIGGDGSGYVYTDDDWRALAEGMAAWHREQGVRWCVTTSRRTPPEVEQSIIETVPAGAIHEACWWHRGDRRACMTAFVAAGRQVFCTEDSMSMLEEVIAGGRGLVALSPARAEANGFFRDFLAQREAAGRMVRLPLREFAGGGGGFPVENPRGWRLVEAGEMEAGVARLLEFLGL
ncbi:MAG: ELM1/GtrOC1 family putative glycosyltransferase [Verrucomicrobiota bacterium]